MCLVSFFRVRPKSATQDRCSGRARNYQIGFHIASFLTDKGSHGGDAEVKRSVDLLPTHAWKVTPVYNSRPREVAAPREGGGIGRRTGFRFQRRKA